MTAPALEPAQATFVDYYRCPAGMVQFDTAPGLSASPGFFEFRGQRYFGQTAGFSPSPDVTGPLTGVDACASKDGGNLILPFDLAEVVTNLREERYRNRRDATFAEITSTRTVERLYYSVRPVLPVRIRKHLQRARLNGWKQIPFPRWPVDSTVDDLMRASMGLLLRATGVERIPFVWFWPDGAPSCTMLTHDVEGRRGLDFCEPLMNLDNRFGMKAAFQLIPEGTEHAWDHAPRIRQRGFEVNLHDLNHDGRLYLNKTQFLDRVRRINDYGRQHGCRGFRSGAMYREQAWYDAFDFEYDMSVPNVAHLEPQRGGCCTVMPYFVGRILELPLTTVQDYSLFFVLNDYSVDLWRKQIDLILRQNGLVSIITHPDYLTEARERGVYTELLAHLRELRDSGQTWPALPGQINQWWRQRRELTLEKVGASWRARGTGSDRARVAYARLDGDRVVYSFDQVA